MIAIGLILAVAVNLRLAGIDLHLVGWILTVVGVVGLVASIAMVRRDRAVVVREEEPLPPARDPRYR